MFFFRIALYFTNTNRAMAYFSYILLYFDSRLIPSFPQYPGHPAGCLCTIPKLGTLRDLWYRLFAMCVFPSFLGEEQHLIRISSDTCFTRIVGTQPPGGRMGTSEGVCNPQGDTAAFLQSSLSRPTISTHPMGSQCEAAAEKTAPARSLLNKDSINIAQHAQRITPRMRGRWLESALPCMYLKSVRRPPARLKPPLGQPRIPIAIRVYLQRRAWTLRVRCVTFTLFLELSSTMRRTGGCPEPRATWPELPMRNLPQGKVTTFHP
ncbi:hypothetical protein JVT61DRAFT_13656 [Boletus reticuloceps]|uniref:Uncharacterized protein n=1 Tax=Boletus reticuloceps TaxID=495285 RepID=A0A8I3A4B1_9AGAM|nr:hypothetical protein JVT61DRAFT_13656 [Boletus reticuloceps]